MSNANAAIITGFRANAGKVGAPDNPAWYHNLLAHPDATVEVGQQVVTVRAREAAPDEREPIWADQKRDHRGFATYEERTDRMIPGVILERR